MAQVCVSGCGANDAGAAGRPSAPGRPGLPPLLPAGGHRLLDAASGQLLDVLQIRPDCCVVHRCSFHISCQALESCCLSPAAAHLDLDLDMQFSTHVQ